MGKNEVLVNEKMIVNDEEKSKKIVLSQLMFCKTVLGHDHKQLEVYIGDYSRWIDEKKSIINPLKDRIDELKEIDSILAFSDIRLTFLKNKLEVINKYRSYVRNAISNFSTIASLNELKAIQTRLVLILTSLGLELPNYIFGELL